MMDIKEDELLWFIIFLIKRHYGTKTRVKLMEAS